MGESATIPATRTLARERQAIREGLLVRPAPELGTLTLTGTERQNWLNGLVTANLAPLSAGRGAFALAVGKNGKILAELWILLVADRILVGVERDRLAMLADHFDKHLIMEDVEVANASASFVWSLLYGPHTADAIVAARTGAAHAAAIETTGLGGAALAIPVPLIASVEASLQELGAVVASPEAWEAIRIELGAPRYGVDFGPDNYPQEAGLESIAVSFEKGCYLGQETVFMLQTRGHVKKRLVRLVIEGAAVLNPGSEITVGDAPVGALTSVAPNPDAPELFALGYVKYKHAETGKTMTVGGRTARVVAGLAPEG